MMIGIIYMIMKSLNQFAMNKVTAYNFSVVELPRIENRSVNITCIHDGINVPFVIKRVFYTDDISGCDVRVAYAHKENYQFLIAARGNYKVVFDGDINKRTVLLNRPFYRLHIPSSICAVERGFFSSTICLVLASHGYEVVDYIRYYYREYLHYVNILNNARLAKYLDCYCLSQRKEVA